MTHDACLHASEWGELKADRRRWEAHMVNTVETLDELKSAIHEIRSMLTAQNVQLKEIAGIKDGLLQVSTQLHDANRDRIEGVRRGHERMDAIESKIDRHLHNHCDSTLCKNEQKVLEFHTRCAATGGKLDTLHRDVEILLPIARALEIMRDKMWIIILTILAVIIAANFLGVEAGIIYQKMKG
jgi:type III secretory pathway component EscS